MAEPWAWDTPLCHLPAAWSCPVPGHTSPTMVLVPPPLPQGCPQTAGSSTAGSRPPSHPPLQARGSVTAALGGGEEGGIKPAAVSFPAPWLQSERRRRGVGGAQSDGQYTALLPPPPSHPAGMGSWISPAKKKGAEVTPRGHSSMAWRKSSSSSSAIVIRGGGAGGGRPSCLPRARWWGSRGCPLHMM